MRTVSAGELSTLASSTRNITARVKVKNGSGTWIDRSSWVESVTIDQDIDQPVSGCTVSFRRDSGTTQSLAPLRTDSTLNRLDDGTTYSPALDVNRAITVEVATTVIGAAIVSGPEAPFVSSDFKMLFVGTIDTIDSAHSPITVSCRDKGGLLVDRWVETEASYGDIAGIDLETVMASILNNAFGLGVVPLYTPVAPGFVISPAYVQQRQSIMDAQYALAQLPGWDVRYRWDDTTWTFRLTLSEPPRANTTPAHTFGPDNYFDVTRLELDLTNIKNVITVEYFDTAADGRKPVTVFDATSITKYGRRFFYIQEPDGSPINTNAEATAMANAALSDLKEPKAEFEIDAPFFWPADLWDLYRFPTNAVHFNSNQDWAVVSISHQLSRGRHRTKLQVRGLPAGGYSSWRGRGMPETPTPGEVGRLEAHVEEMAGATVPGVQNLRYYATGGTQPYTYERRIAVDTLSAGTWSAPAALGAGVTEWVVAHPFYPTRVYLRVTDNKGIVSNADAFTLGGKLPAILETRARVIATTPTTLTVRLAVADPYPQGANSATITYSEMGLGAATTPASGGTVTPAATITEVAGSYIDYTVTRQVFGIGAGRITFTVTATDRTSATDSVDVPEQDRDTVYLVARARVIATTANTVTVRLAVADPYPQGANTATITYSETGMGAATSPVTGQTVTPAATLTEAAGTYVDFTLTRPAVTTGTGRITFTVTAGARVSATDAVDVPAVEQNDTAQGTVAIDTNGNWDAIIDGPANALSFRWTSSTSSFPVDATVTSSGTLVTGTGRLLSIAGGPLTLGQNVFITIIPFSAVSGGGTVLPSIHIQGSYQNTSGSRTSRYAATAFFSPTSANAQQYDRINWMYGPKGKTTTDGTGTPDEHYANVPVATGMTITAFRLRTYAVQTYSEVAMKVYRQDADGSSTQLGSTQTTTPSAGYSTLTVGSLTESASAGRSYLIKCETMYDTLNLNFNGTGMLWFEVDEDYPNLATGL